jgi:hypothetical protein
MRYNFNEKDCYFNYEKTNVKFLMNVDDKFRACKAKKLKFLLKGKPGTSFTIMKDLLAIFDEFETLSIEEPEEIEVDSLLSDVLQNDKVTAEDKEYITEKLLDEDYYNKNPLFQEYFLIYLVTKTPFILIPCIGIKLFNQGNSTKVFYKIFENQCIYSFRIFPLESAYCDFSDEEGSKKYLHDEHWKYKDIHKIEDYSNWIECIDSEALINVHLRHFADDIADEHSDLVKKVFRILKSKNLHYLRIDRAPGITLNQEFFDLLKVSKNLVGLKLF